MRAKSTTWERLWTNVYKRIKAVTFIGYCPKYVRTRLHEWTVVVPLNSAYCCGSDAGKVLTPLLFVSLE